MQMVCKLSILTLKLLDLLKSRLCFKEKWKILRVTQKLKMCATKFFLK